MKTEKLLEKIKFLKDKSDIYKSQGKDCPGLYRVINIIENCKNTLTERQKQIFKLYYLEELTLVNIAAKIGWSRDTVSRDIKKINHKFQVLFDDVDIERYLMNKTVYNYLKWELDHLKESINLVERYAAGEIIILNKRWIMRILKIYKAFNKAKDIEDQDQVINIIANEMGLIA